MCRRWITHRSKCGVAKEALGTQVSPEEGCRSVAEGQTGKCGQHDPEPLRSSAVRVKKRGVVTWANLHQWRVWGRSRGLEMRRWVGESLLRLAGQSRGRCLRGKKQEQELLGPGDLHTASLQLLTAQPAQWLPARRGWLEPSAGPSHFTTSIPCLCPGPGARPIGGGETSSLGLFPAWPWAFRWPCR